MYSSRAIKVTEHRIRHSVVLGVTIHGVPVQKSFSIENERCSVVNKLGYDAD